MVPALKKCPQKRGVVQKMFIQTPKKPNSAKRKVAKVKLSTGRIISCYIPGIGQKLSKHSVLLVRGGRAQDLIGVRYKPIFGKFDLRPPTNRVTRLSKFGISNKNFHKADVIESENEASVVDDSVEISKDATLQKPISVFEYVQRYTIAASADKHIRIRLDEIEIETELAVDISQYLYDR